MYCKNCGKELLEGTRFCSACGEPVMVEADLVNEEPIIDVVFDEQPEVPVKHVPRCFTIFGKIGYGLGLAGFICGFIPFICYVGLELSTIGLVFSILGKRDEELASKTKKGRVFSILGLSIGFVMTVVCAIIIELMA